MPYKGKDEKAESTQSNPTSDSELSVPCKTEKIDDTIGSSHVPKGTELETGAKKAFENVLDMNEDKDRPSKRIKTDQDIYMRLLLPRTVSSGIIGKCGENIQQLRDDYKADISFPDSRGPDRIISITAAVHFVLDMMKNFIPMISNQMNRCKRDGHEIRMLIHHSLAGHLVSRRCKKLNEIRQESKASVKVYADCAPFALERIVEMSGSKEQITRCMSALFRFMKEVQPNRTQLLYNAHNCNPGNAACYGGYTVEIFGQNPSYVSANSEPVDDDSGSMENKVTSNVIVPKWVASAILGIDGKNVREIQDDSGAKIVFGDESERTNRAIFISGTIEQIELAKYLMQMTIMKIGYAQ